MSITPHLRPNHKANHYLDGLDTEKLSRGLSLFSPTERDIKLLLGLASQKLPHLASFEQIQKVYHHNPDSLMCVVRNKRDGSPREPDSFISLLYLNDEGLNALLSGEMDLSNPDLRYLSRQNEKAAAIYVWLLFLSPSTAGGVGLMYQRLCAPNYRQAPLYARPMHDKAHTFLKSLGFVQLEPQNAEQRSDLLVYGRDEPAEEPEVEQLQIRPVRNLEDFQKVVAIRAATYMAEQDCPYAEEYDGNDFAASHLIAYDKGEPVACIRLRFFAGFAKLERLAVIKRYRRSRLANKMIEAAKRLASQKGYTHLYGQAEAHVVKLWKRHGFIPRTEEATISFSGNSYIEGDLFMPPINSAISASSPPEIINRPEGAWDRPGILENQPVPTTRYRREFRLPAQ